MTSVIPDIQDILKKPEVPNSQFFADYEKFATMYQELINIGVTSKRQSQLHTISDKPAVAPLRFNLSEK
jgi:hypothetical protein